MSQLERIYEELKTLPPHKLAVAAQLIYGLREINPAERLATLERAGGSISQEEADAMAEALAGCRRIDASEW